MQLLVAINGTSAASPTVAFSFSLLVSPACPPACRPRMCCACVHVLLAPALGRSKRNVGYGRAPLGRLISNTTHRPKCNCLCWTAGLSGWSLTPAGLGGPASVGGDSFGSLVCYAKLPCSFMAWHAPSLSMGANQGLAILVSARTLRASSARAIVL